MLNNSSIFIAISDIISSDMKECPVEFLGMVSCKDLGVGCLMARNDGVPGGNPDLLRQFYSTLPPEFLKNLLKAYMAGGEIVDKCMAREKIIETLQSLVEDK